MNKYHDEFNQLINSDENELLPPGALALIENKIVELGSEIKKHKKRAKYAVVDDFPVVAVVAAKSKDKIFDKRYFTATRLSVNERCRLKAQLESHGGVYSDDLKENTTTLICKSITQPSRKMSIALKRQLELLCENDIKNAIELGELHIPGQSEIILMSSVEAWNELKPYQSRRKKHAPIDLSEENNNSNKRTKMSESQLNVTEDHPDLFRNDISLD